jgi:hypothetical protein
VLVAGYLLALPLLGLAAEKSASELDLKTERVIVFKDGYSLFIKHGTATTDKNGEVFTDDVPDAAVLGSFWAVPEEGRLVSMLAGWKTTKNSEEKPLPCREPIEILLANKGKRAKVELHDKTLYQGVIHEVLVDKTQTALGQPQLESLDLASSAVKPKAVPLSSRVDRLAPPPTDEHTLATITGSNFVLRTEEGDVLLPVSQVRSISVKEMQTTLAKTLTTSKKTKRLSFKFEGGEQKRSLTLMYFRPGIRWIPTYRISLHDKEDKKKRDAAKGDEKGPAKSATVSLQAELLNEAEDLDDVPIDIVVGVPNFRFRGTPSPLVLESVLRNALAEAAPDLMGNGTQQFSNSMYTQRSGEFRRNQAQANAVADGGNVQLPGELTAGGAQDLFVYNLPKLALGKGDRIAVPIFTTDVPYRDIYTWDVHVTKQDNAAAPSGSGTQSPLVLSKNEVWHQIQLINTTNVPWTTGAAMIMEGNQPLAQELLTYTPPKDEVRVPLTVSVDTRGSLTEKEVGRELKSIQWEGYNYARIEREMRLDLCNNKPIEIEAEITLHVGGKVDKASHEGSVVLSGYNPADWVQYQGHPAVNNSSVVTWKTKLKPGDNFEPTATYHYFSRH